MVRLGSSTHRIIWTRRQCYLFTPVQHQVKGKRVIGYGGSEKMVKLGLKLTIYDNQSVTPNIEIIIARWMYAIR